MSVDLVGGDEAPSDHVVSRVSFHHVTLDAGNESVLLRFEYESREQAACVLVDAGDQLDLDSYLRPTDTLAGVCLTHAHADHYQSLDRVLEEDVPLFASPATADVLETVLTVAEDRGFVSDPGRVLDATRPVDGWVDVAPSVRIRPVPAGHTPGAVGFVVRFRDGRGSHDMLFTGDFTRRDVGGYPGFDPDDVLDVETLFLTVATAEDAEAQLTDGVTEAVERAHSGARVLVTAGGLQGVHLATLLGTVSSELDLGVRVRVVGQAAKLYEDLGYDHESVRSIPRFERPDDCLENGVVTVAGPDVPTEGSAGRLYDAVCDDPNACLVQFVSSGESPLTGGGPCATFDYRGSMHPPGEALAAVVDALDPIEVVTVHEHGGAGDRYNDLDSCVWSSTKCDELTLYEDGRWLAPPWTQAEYAWGSDSSLDIGHLVGDQFGDVPLASLDRGETVDPEREGFDVERLRRRLHLEQSSEQSTTQPTPSMTDSSDTHDQFSGSETRLYQTVSARPESTGSLSTDSLVPESIVSRRAWERLGDDPFEQTSAEAENAETSAPSAASHERSTTDDEASTVGDEQQAVADAETVVLEVDPLLLALVERQTREQPVAAFVTEALDAYLEAILRQGASPEGTTDALDIDVGVGDCLGGALTEAVEDEGYRSVSATVRTALAELLGGETSPTVTVPERDLNGGFVDAAVTNDDYGFETRREFVDAAVLWALDER